MGKVVAHNVKPNKFSSNNGNSLLIYVFIVFFLFLLVVNLFLFSYTWTLKWFFPLRDNSNIYYLKEFWYTMRKKKRNIKLVDFDLNYILLVYSFKFDRLCPTIFNNFDTLFIVRTVGLLKIAINFLPPSHFFEFGKRK